MVSTGDYHSSPQYQGYLISTCGYKSCLYSGAKWIANEKGANRSKTNSWPILSSSGTSTPHIFPISSACLVFQAGCENLPLLSVPSRWEPGLLMSLTHQQMGMGNKAKGKAGREVSDHCLLLLHWALTYRRQLRQKLGRSWGSQARPA